MGSEGGGYGGEIDFDVMRCKDGEEELLVGTGCDVESAVSKIWMIVF